MRHDSLLFTSRKLSTITTLPCGARLSPSSSWAVRRLPVISTVPRHSSTETKRPFPKSQSQRNLEEAVEFVDGKTDIPEAQRVAEIRERVVKEHKAKVEKSRFNFNMETWIMAVTVGFIAVEYFGLNFWDRADWWGGEKRQ